MRDWIGLWRDGLKRIGEKRFGTITEERKVNIELSLDEGRVLCGFLSQRLTPVGDGSDPPFDLSWPELFTLYVVVLKLLNATLEVED